MKTVLTVTLLSACMFGWYSERLRREAEVNLMRCEADPMCLGNGWYRIQFFIIPDPIRHTYLTRMVYTKSCEELRWQYAVDSTK